LKRTVAAAAALLSFGIHFGVLPGNYFIFHHMFLFKFLPELWRPVTSFLITGSGLNMLFDTYFLYQYLSGLEIGNPRFSKKADLIWYLMFVSGVILVGSALCSSLASVQPLSSTAPNAPLISARIVLCLYYYHGSWN
jgi:Derlin-2/3